MSDNSFDNGMRGARRRHNPSLFGPIVLIAIGAFFLLRNMGMLPEVGWNWGAVWQLWPLWLIFMGVNIIVRQVPRPFGALLSGVVGIAAVGVFGYVLFFGEDNPTLQRFGISAETADLKTETISYAGNDVSEAVVDINFGAPGATLRALDDSRDVINGRVTSFGDITFDASDEGGEATISLSTHDSAGWYWFLNPNNWSNIGDEANWELGLNPRVETDLRLDVGAGAVDLQLADLTLSHLDVDGGAGSVTLVLPDGNYNVVYDASAGSTQLWLGESGRQEVEISGSAGSITLYLPDSMEARVEVNDGAGSFSIDRDRFTQVSGNKDDDGVWETDGYEDAPNRVDLFVDIGAGSVRIR
ncbi:MAG: LiaF-related protein [Chloroflexota bacterium]